MGACARHVNARLVNMERPLISRKLLFGNPTRAHARISPDGARLAFLAPMDNVLNVWVASAASPADARPVTRDRHRGIRAFAWAYTNRHMLYTQDTDGDENWHVYCVDLATAEIRDLTPIDKIAARIEGVSARVPEDVLVGINDRGDGQWHDVYRIHIGTGKRTLVQENPGFAGFAADDDYRVRFAVTVTADAGHLYLKPEASSGWREWVRIEPEDAMTTHPAGFDKTAARCYMLDSRGRDTSALKALDLETGAEELLAETDLADIDGLLIHPKDKHVQAVSFTHSRRRWHVVDPEIQGDLDYLAGLADGDVKVTSRSLDDWVWTVAFTMDTGPARFYLYDRAAREARFLFTSQPELEGLPLARMHPVIVRARDGLELVSYLSLPVPLDPEGQGRPEHPLPMVLLVHGGPWARDDWGYDPMHQWLADRGYAVLSVNYRGSTGFGKAFINRANREWAAAMHDDLIDAVDWAVAEGIADRGRVAIMGGSYGGYATLVGLTFTPDRFACGVDIVGPSNLVTLLENPPPYWAPMMPLLKVRVGDYTTDEGRALLESRSPLSFADRIRSPLLIGQGRQDPRVKQAESDQIVEALTAKGIPVVYMLFTEEGHGFAKPENRTAFYAVAEAFLAAHLGGRAEPIGDAFDGAAFTVPTGPDATLGLSDALG